MLQKIFTVIDDQKGRAHSVSLEALVLARSLCEEFGGTSHAVVLGGAEELLDSLNSVKVNSLVSVENPELRVYDPEIYTSALASLLQNESPDLVLFGHTYQNMDLVPRLSARLGLGLLTDCTGFKMSGDQLLLTRQMFRSKLNADIRLDAPTPWLVTVQAGAFSADSLEGDTPEVRTLKVDFASNPMRKVVETVEAGRRQVDLGKAEVIIGVGRGIRKEEQLETIRELAELLGAEIGASRPVVDSEWLPRDRQIGSSGQNVSPKLYLALGISGAIQHVVGMKNAGCIVAVNTDPNAPIFNIAHYGIVGDVGEVVPELIKQLRDRG